MGFWTVDAADSCIDSLVPMNLFPYLHNMFVTDDEGAEGWGEVGSGGLTVEAWDPKFGIGQLLAAGHLAGGCGDGLPGVFGGMWTF